MLDTIEPSTTGLLVFDLLEGGRSRYEERGILGPVLKLVAACRDKGIPLFVTRPVHRPDGADLAVTEPDMDRQHQPYTAERPRTRIPSHGGAGALEVAPLAELQVSAADFDIPKHRWSAFFQTALDLSLRRSGVKTLLVIGGTTHIGVASSVYAARDLDYQIVVVRDACHGEAAELRSLLDDIFPQVCHVRTVDEVIALMS